MQVTVKVSFLMTIETWTKDDIANKQEFRQEWKSIKEQHTKDLATAIQHGDGRHGALKMSLVENTVKVGSLYDNRIEVE